jgi:hypothetical protein
MSIKITHHINSRKDENRNIHSISLLTSRGLPLELRIYDTVFYPSVGPVYFSEAHCPPHICANMATQIITTGRTMREYTDLLGQLPKRDDLTYIEFGCGLSSCIPAYSTIVGNPKQIIALDRFEYSCGEVLLSYARKLDYNSPLILEKITQMQENLSVITDPQKVTLLNMNLSEAVATRPDLAHVADIGIDVAGVFGYLCIEIPSTDFVTEHAKTLHASLHGKAMQDVQFFLKPDAPLLYTNKLRGT